MVRWCWSANALFWQVSSDNNMDVQYHRIRNSEKKKQVTWMQKKPLIRQHLDYYLVCMKIQDKVAETSIITTKDSNNSAITMTPSSRDKQKFGPSYWKFIALAFKRMPVIFNSSPHIILIGLNSKILMTNGSFRT